MIWEDRDKITGGSIKRSLVMLAIPAVASTFFTIIFEIVDMFWVGKLGTASVAALSVASFVIWILRGLAMTVATGALALVSRRAGEKREEQLRHTIVNSIVSGFIFALFVLAIFLPLILNVYEWIGLESGVASLAAEYSLVFLSGLIFVYMMMVFEHIIRGVGNTRIPMIITGISLLLNAAVDPVFIFVLDMGIRGAAYATILAQMIGALLMAIVLIFKIFPLRETVIAINARFWGDYFYKIIKIGAPVALGEAGFSFIYLLLSGIITRYGKEPLAALGIAHRLEAVPFFISLGFSMAVATMVGQNLGAGKVENARESVYFSLKIVSLILLVISLLFFLFAPWLFRFFIDDPSVIAHGTAYLRIIAVLEVFLGFEVVIGGAFSGAGDTRPPFFIVFPITLLRVPLAYILGVVLKMGIESIWWIIAVTTFLKGVLLLLVFRQGKWAAKEV
jgi:putative MATE family efflux protein